MAKRIAIIVLLIIIFGGALWQHIYISGATDKLASQLDKINDALNTEDFSTALNRAQTFKENWEKEKHLFETLFEHEEVDLISASTARLQQLCAESNKSEALAETAETLYYIKHIHEIDSVKWENIF
jgi:predicted Holliday junction resolvase-like endonuclease